MEARATVRDVAKAAGVSISTVSRVMSGHGDVSPETVAAVTAAADRLSYRPSAVARSLRLRRTGLIGLVITDIENPFFPSLVRAVDDAARAMGSTLLLGNSSGDHERETAFLDLLIRGRMVDGLIVASDQMTNRNASAFLTSEVPIVVANTTSPHPSIPAVVSDNHLGGQLAIRHLLELGHRRLGVIRGPDQHEASVARIQGISRAWSEAGMRQEALVVRVSDGSVASGFAAAEALLGADELISGFVCYNDLTAIGACKALQRAGLNVPGDVSVVGFDDIPATEWATPTITTVVQQTALMGRLAVELLERRIGGAEGRDGLETGDGDIASVLVPVFLRRRESTGPASAKGRRAARG